MKKTLYLYIFKEIPPPFLLGVATFTFVLLMGRLLRLAEMVVTKGVPLADVLRMVFYLLPSFLLVTIPMAFLLAILLAFGRLSGDSEITAMKASGVSLYGLLPPVFCFALIAYLAGAFITVYAVPWGNTSFKKLLVEVVEARASLGIKEKIFNDDFPGLVIYTDRYNQQKQTMSGILIQDERDPLEPSTIYARSGVINSDPATKSIRLRLDNGSIHRTQGKTGYRLVEFRNYDLNINLNQAAQTVNKNELDMSLAELRANLASGRFDAKMMRDMRLEYHRRFSLPFACLIFALVGMPLGIQNQRSGKAAGFTMSIGLLLAYYIVLSAGKALGERELLSPLLAVWAPNLLFVSLGIYLFKTTAAEERIPLYAFLTGIAGWLRSRLTKRGER
ncbi:LPS export ABC transporter permease LptF [Geotalea uraniireducens]|uniref:Permease YjgP/YjgQ family protein n=1 Tax=Geotalea uraniireducens (strain Rf4) TaxID=351605 RepID=A5G7W9_GEOUR|nr:LPS export ABC transporter permease LptF [Geotalea uraniireducens]ABQ27887.1 permease YjgP/YjgQ family protein [Geotalea uraniireducens Rf4]